MGKKNIGRLGLAFSPFPTFLSPRRSGRELVGSGGRAFLEEASGMGSSIAPAMGEGGAWGRGAGAIKGRGG